ncbi:hypothetical protein RM863_31515 [Streptomyces sp. DSM 41014]|uniref:Transposase n=1 Tax=Streptomyces hintoniae TaxID=3075521 RepID=A0ABU2UUC2_9ACTN|nr:hypothetical protein [Streptomyces sp. DSM 41014]MDT0476665.1 hypothetical protein [Streptomyces sp. DSM 41014]
MPALRFWCRVAVTFASDAWTEEHRQVPGRPQLPPDTRISCDAPARI